MLPICRRLLAGYNPWDVYDILNFPSLVYNGSFLESDDTGAGNCGRFGICKEDFVTIRIQFLPKTKLGRWPVGLIVVFLSLITLGNFVVKIQGPRDDQTFFD